MRINGNNAQYLLNIIFNHANINSNCSLLSHLCPIVQCGILLVIELYEARYSIMNMPVRTCDDLYSAFMHQSVVSLSFEVSL